jgi:hypothetical protein
MKVTILPPEYAGSPDVVAMLQAFYSRSLKPIGERLSELGTDLSAVRKALKNYYIGYGHRSIGQCGTITLFIEDVPFYVAKAIQHHQLYNGQEASTRYIDFSRRSCNSPEKDHPWFDLYDTVLPIFQAAAPKVFGIDDPTPTEKKAMQAWAFDRARGWLPIGAHTSLSWHTSFDNLNVHLDHMETCGDPAIEDVAKLIRKTAYEQFPDAVMDKAVAPTVNVLKVCDKQEFFTESMLCYDYGVLIDYSTLKNRKFCEYVKSPCTQLVKFDVSTELDYGAWREIARHRSGYIQWQMPSRNFHDWYVNELKAAIALVGVGDVESILSRTDKALTVSAALGCSTRTRLIYDLGAFLYVMELRSMQTVHPVLRNFTKKMAGELDNMGIPHKIDMSDIDYKRFLKRGSQDIVTVKSN